MYFLTNENPYGRSLSLRRDTYLYHYDMLVTRSKLLICQINIASYKEYKLPFLIYYYFYL